MSLSAFPAYVETPSALRTLAERLGRASDAAESGLLRLRLGVLHAAAGDHEAALRHLRAAADTAGVLEDELLEAHAVLALGRVCVRRDEAVAAERALERAGMLVVRLGEPALEAEQVALAAEIAWAAGRRTEAEARWQRALALFGDARDENGRSRVHERLGMAALTQRQLSRADEHADAAIPGNERGLGVQALGRALLLKGRITAERGHHQAVRNYYEHAIDMFQAHGYFADLAESWLALARLFGAGGGQELAEHRDYASEALRTATGLFMHHGTRRDLAETRRAFAGADPGGDWRTLVTMIQTLSAAPAAELDGRAARCAAKLLNAERVLIVRCAPHEEPHVVAELNLEPGAGEEAGARIAGALGDDAASWLRLSDATPSGVCARLSAGERTLGAIYCDKAYSGSAFAPVDLDLLAGFAAAFAGLFERAHAPRPARTPEPPRWVRGARPEPPFGQIVSRSRAFVEVLELARIAASSETTVLITGESGTGKEVVAHAIHRASGRTGALVAVNCAAVPRDLLESELFGYEQGAFTGARRSGLSGKFELAAGGTLLLDEIGEMPLDMQAKLLRVLDHKRMYRLGGQKEIAVDVRIIAATNRDLRAAMQERQFRSDLYFRLRVLHLELPPLRDRPEDIEVLATHFLEGSSARRGKRLRAVSADVLRVLEAYPWPGNVRELQNLLELEVQLAGPDDEVLLAPPRMLQAGRSPEGTAGPSARVPHSLDDNKRKLLTELLERHRGHISRVAAALGVSRTTVYGWLRRFDVDARSYR